VQVKLKSDIAEFIAEKVRAGEFASADEAVNFLLTAAKDQTGSGNSDVGELRAEIDPAIAEAERGEFVEFDAEDVIAERRRAPTARRKKGA
jgi:Arc/MetJ-type ribon-helix-helix transcriptional regulator